MDTLSILCTMYCFTACQTRISLTSDVNGRHCENTETECDEDDGGSSGTPNCNGPLCLPDTQCSYYSALIQSPNYPKSYPPNQDVYWFLKLTKDIRIDAAVITVEEFNVEKDHDWVNIGVRNQMDSRTVRESLTGSLRQGQSYRIPFSFGVQVYLHFHSDNSNQSQGFRFSYNVVPREQRHVRIVELTVGSVMLRWSPSMIKPTGTITYKVYYGLNGNRPTLAGFHLVTARWDYNLTGLRDSTSYFAYVVEVMDCGREDVGHMVNFTTRRGAPVMSLPDPVDLKVMEVDPGTVFVSWTTTSPSASPSDGYRLYLVSDTDTLVKTTAVRYITLRNLGSNQDYNITVTSVNGQGKESHGNWTIMQLQNHQAGESAWSITPGLARSGTAQLRSTSLLLQLPACRLFQRIAENLKWDSGPNFTLDVMMVESTVVSSPPSDLIPADSNATHRDTDGGHSGPYVAAHLFPGTACSHPISTGQLTHNLGIFQVGSEESCLPAQTCNGMLRSNMTYRGRYVLMNGRTPILVSQWSQPFTTRAVTPCQQLRVTPTPPALSTITVISTLTALCLLLPLCLLAATYWSLKRTDRKWLVCIPSSRSHQEPIQLSVSVSLSEITVKASRGDSERYLPTSTRL